METKSINLKLVIKITTFHLGSISNEFESDDLNEVSFKGNVYDFSVDYSATAKSNILNIHKYLMKKIYIKCLELLKKCLLYY